MKKLARCLVAAFALFATVASADNAPAGGGEDFPFFCNLGSEEAREQFEIVRDAGSPTGWTVTFFTDGQNSFTMPVTPQATEDGYGTVFYGRVRTTRPMWDLAFMFHLGKTQQFGDMAEWREVRRFSHDDTWRLRTAYCRQR